MKTRILITVKTYPTLSSKYDELVCTAGFKEDGTWIRIYPVQFRKMSYTDQYRKYDWIEVELVKNTSDSRPESFRPYSHETEFNKIGSIDTKSNWLKRKEIVLNKVYTDLQLLINEAKDRSICTSLAVFKPTKFLNFTIEEVSREWDRAKLERLKQLNIFEQSSKGFEIVRKLPFKFSYRFEDNKGKVSKMMIEDWEIGQLYWNCLKRTGSEKEACQLVKKKYWDDFVQTKDIHLFLGTTKVHHYTAPNPFVIIGTFTPKIELQRSLF